MAGQRVLILGAGWGGLTLAHSLRGMLPAEHEIVLVERRDRFILYPGYLWLLSGDRAAPSAIEAPLAELARDGIEWRHDEVTAIDPAARSVRLASGSDLTADYLVLALGAELDPARVPGFEEGAVNLYDTDGAVAAHDALEAFPGGQVAVLITRTPYRCPAAPYEAAFLVESLLRTRGVSAGVSIYTPERAPMPVAGPAVGEALRAMLAEHHIDYYPEHVVQRVDPETRRLVFDGSEASYDLLLGVPAHRAPSVVEAAGLTDATGYVPVHPQTLELLADAETLTTRYPGVYAIGDVVAIRLLNQLLLPKAGVFAEAHARVVAANIAAAVNGQPATSTYDGRGFCFVDTGDGLAARGAGNFYAYPGPSVALEPPSEVFRREKFDYENMLRDWFRHPAASGT